jgi:hypothetical protein
LLVSEYKANELRADGRFKGKLIRTHGTTEQVGKSPSGEPCVTIRAATQAEVPALQCVLADAQDPEALALSAGDTATVQGRVERLLGQVRVMECTVNPVAHLCRRMKAVTGARKCTMSAETGDASGIVFEKDAQGGGGSIGTLACETEQGGSTAAERYASMVRLLAQRHPDDPLLGSPRVHCYALLTSLKKKKRAPFPEPLRAKVQAFFDAL